MRNSRDHRMRGRLNSYLGYSVGCAVAWGLVWVIVEIVDPRKTVDHLTWVFLGWLIGWTSATIARVVYPPPQRRPRVGPRSFFQGLSGR